MSADPQLAWAPQPGPQTAFITCPIEDICFGGARGGGKTDSLLGRAITRSLRHAGHYRGLLVRRTYDELDEVIGRAQEIYDRVQVRWSEKKHTFYFPWGGWLKLRYLQRDADAARYQGHSYNDLMVDEAGNFPQPAPIDKLMGTLRDKNGVPCRFAMTANPGGPGHEWIESRYVTPSPPGVPFADPAGGGLRVYIPSLLTDNPALLDADPGYIRRLMKVGPGWLVRAWILGDWNARPIGPVVDLAWFKRYTGAPDGVVMVVQSWDTGNKPGELNAPSVCTTWAVTRTAAYLLHVFRKRMPYPELMRATVTMYNEYRPATVLIEDKASGQSLIQDLREKTPVPVVAIEPEGDKVSRMVAATGPIEAGKIYLPTEAPWLRSFEGELSIFPMGPYKDQADSASQFINWMRKGIAGRAFDFDSAGARTAVAATSTESAGLYDAMAGDPYAGYNP